MEIRKSRRILRFLFLVVVHNGLDAKACDSCGKAYLPGIIEDPTVPDINKILGYVQRDRKKDHWMEEPEAVMVSHSDYRDQEYNITHIPAKICKELRYIRFLHHDKRICGPIIVTEKICKKESGRQKPSSFGFFNIIIQTAQHPDNGRKKHNYISDQIHVQHF